MYHDENGDGVQDEEPGIANVRLTVQEITGGPKVERRTDSAGFFQFDNLSPGTYLLTEETPDGWSEAYPVGQLAFFVAASHTHQVDFAHHPTIWLPLYRR